MVAIIVFISLLAILTFIEVIVLKYLSRYKSLRFLIKAVKIPSILILPVIAFYSSIPFISLDEKDIHLLKKITDSVLILGITLLVANLVIVMLSNYASKASIPVPSTGLIFNIIRASILLLGIFTILSYNGVPILHLITTLGIGALAISLALQPTLSNFFAGLNLLVSGYIKVGDYIILENDYEGYVKDITWMNTVLLTRTNALIIVPNSRLTASIVRNHTKPDPSLNVVVPVGVSYESDLEKVERVTVEVAKKIQKSFDVADPEFEPFIRYTAFSDSSINFNVILRSKHPDGQFLIRHEFIKMLKEAYEKEGIQIPYPQRVVYIKNNS